MLVFLATREVIINWPIGSVRPLPSFHEEMSEIEKSKTKVLIISSVTNDYDWLLSMFRRFKNVEEVCLNDADLPEYFLNWACRAVALVMLYRQ